MDQVKEILGVIKRQHFWFLSPLLLIIGFVGWMMATKKLNGEFEKFKVDAGSLVTQMESVKSKAPHPNPEYHEAMEKLIAARMENVRTAWEKKWERQKTELKWPEQLDREFLDQVAAMRPIEKATGKILNTDALAYAAHVKRELPMLAERIGAKWAPSAVGRGAFGGSGFRDEGSRSGESARTADGSEPEKPPLVEWSPANQGALEARFTWTGAPSTKEVLYAQEDMWVITNLIDIIKRTNGDAIVRSQTPIKEIQDIQLGKDVVPPSRQEMKVIRPTALPVEGDDAPADAGLTPAPTYAPDKVSTPTGDGMPAVPAAAIDLELVKNRYYDENYEPIADQESLLAYVTVAKRIPVRMRLVIDERQLNKLLVECANAPMTFEVQQLRFNPPDPNDIMRGGMDLGGVARAKLLKANEYLNFDRTVELFGIIYVFNPVSEAVLKGEQGGTLPPPADASASLMNPSRQVVLR